jgi:Fe-Mn family superoxide dismutase
MRPVDRRTAMLQMSAVAGAVLLAENVPAANGEQAQAAPAPAPMGPFTLPKLPYGYEALEPSFDTETMHLHHDKHHQAYVNNLNTAAATHPEIASKTVWELVTDLNSVPEPIRTAVRNNGGGHANHSFWWMTLGKGSPSPVGELAKAIDAKFGSFSAFQDKLSDAAMHVFGSGWAWLVKMPDGSLAIESTPNQDSPLSSGHKPILGIDVWEHAYYLKYQNKRADYVKAFFNVVNWDYVSSQFAQKA